MLQGSAKKHQRGAPLPQDSSHQQLLFEVQDLTLRSADTLCEVRAVRAELRNLVQELQHQQHIQQQQQPQHQEVPEVHTSTKFDEDWLTTVASDAARSARETCAVSQKLGWLEEALRQHFGINVNNNININGVLSAISAMEDRVHQRLSHMQLAIQQQKQDQRQEHDNEMLELLRGWTQHVSAVNETPLSAQVSHFSKRGSLFDVSSQESRGEATECDADILKDLHEVLINSTPTRLTFNNGVDTNIAGIGIEQKMRWHRRVQFASCFLVIANIVFMSCALTVSMQKAWKGQEADTWILIVDILFAVLFGLEIVARLVLEGRQFFLVRWNIFDFVVIALSILEVLLALLETLLPFGNLGWLRIMRIIRVFRAARVLQIGSWFHECRLIMDSVGRGILPIVFVLLAIFCVLYMSALGLAQVVEFTIQNKAEDEFVHYDEHEPVRQMYGSLWLCMYTLFQAISGGEAWSHLLQPLDEAFATSPAKLEYKLFFSLYIVCVKFGILNILLGVIVSFVSSMQAWEEKFDNTLESENMQTAISNFRDVLLVNSKDNNTISYRSFAKILAGDGAHFPKQLGLETASMLSLFKLVDANASGSDCRSVERLVCGLMEIKQNPSHFHTVSLMYESQKIIGRINRLSRDLDRQFSRLVMDRQEDAAF